MGFEQITIETTDGISLGATVWSTEADRAVVLLHPATGVSQRLYEAFARFLSANSFAAVTYDYRGTGRSRPASLVGYQATMMDWTDRDVSAVTSWARARFGQLPIFAVGHSIGGHAIGLTSGKGLDAGVLVASHAGVTSTIRGFGERLRVWCVLRVLAPVACYLVGYMPSRRLGLGQDVPQGVMQQWGGWSAMPRYFFDDSTLDAEARFAAVSIPLLAIGFADDPWANAVAVELLTRHFTGTHVERREYSPSELGVSMIGHMGFYRLAPDSAAWMQTLAWLESQAGARRDM